MIIPTKYQKKNKNCKLNSNVTSQNYLGVEEIEQVFSFSSSKQLDDQLS